MMDRIVLSQRAKEQLVQLKRKTGVKHWNVLCRWALALSLSDPSKVSSKPHPADSNVEMTWQTFAGELGDIFVAMLRLRIHQDGLRDSDEAMNLALRAHLHRGIGILASRRDISDIRGLYRQPDNATA